MTTDENERAGGESDRDWQVRVACQVFYMTATDNPECFTPEALRTFVLGLLEEEPVANFVPTDKAKRDLCDYPLQGSLGRSGSTRYYDTDRPSPVSFLAVHPNHRSAIGFSTDYASKAHGLIEVGTTVEIERQVRERFRPLDLEVHVQSAEVFELCFLDVTRKHAREAKRYLGVSGPIDLGTYALRINAGVSSCCTVPLEGVATFEVGDVVTLSVRNTSKEPARFRANLVGFAER